MNDEPKHLWRVVVEATSKCKVADKPFSAPAGTMSVYIATETESMLEVEREVVAAMNTDITFHTIREAKWLGRIINSQP